MTNLYWAEDADRGILASGALLAVLIDDPRVIATCCGWAEEVSAVFDAACRTHPPSAPFEFANLIAMSVYAIDPLPRLIQLVSDELDLSYACAWLPEAMAMKLRFAAIGWETGFSKPVINATRWPDETVTAFMKRLAAADSPPAGHRRVKAGGHHLVRDVQWLYRAEIKKPTDSVIAIAKEYAARMKRQGADDRQIVYAGIRRAKTILSAIVLRDDPARADPCKR